MRLAEVQVESFRIWRRASASFDAGRTVLTGPNGSGKTSLLEAAWYAASLRSHRGAPDAALVRRGDEAAVVRVAVEHLDRTTRVDLEIRTQGRARARVGGSPVARRREALGVLRAQIFAPERMAVVRGDPSERRAFLDELVVQLHPRFHGVIRDYDKALRQRNALLREAAGRGARGRGGAGSQQTLDVWDEALAAAGGELCAGRAEAAALLAPQAAEAYRSVAGDGLSVGYRPNVPDPGSQAPAEAWTRAMRERMEERRSDELIRGVSLVGPHRDDLALDVATLPARTHASQGEAWLAAIALVLGAHAALTGAIGEDPVLLLDDPFAPLDPARRERVAAALPAQAQIVATAADPSEVPESVGAAHVEIESCGTRE